jgi:hypothetical protein
MSDKERVRAIQELRRRAGPVDRRLPRVTAERQALEDQNESPEDGHQFHFSVTLQASYARVPGEPSQDSSEVSDPFQITVRAWSLSEACEKAAQIPLGEWKWPDG